MIALAVFLVGGAVGFGEELDLACETVPVG
jgi:hypothetical protein